MQRIAFAAALLTSAVPGSARAQDAPETGLAPASASPAQRTTPTQSGPEPGPTASVAAVGTLPVVGKPVSLGLPRRHSGNRLTWEPSFKRFGTPEVVVTSVSMGVALTAAIASPLKTGWKQGSTLPGDDAARSALRLPNYQTRLDARDVSDVGLAFLTTFPILVDGMMVAYWYRGSDDVALQMVLIDAEAMSVAAALQGATTFFAGRERPYGQDCGGELHQKSIDCQSPSRNRSFFSGHSTLSFTSAALICAHHQRLNLFDSAADPVTCASGFVAATAVATLRVMGDMHYLSDVLTGAVIGTAVGLGIPLLRYRKGDVGPPSAVQMHLVPAPTGVQLVGTF